MAIEGGLIAETVKVQSMREESATCWGPRKRLAQLSSTVRRQMLHIVNSTLLFWVLLSATIYFSGCISTNTIQSNEQLNTNTQLIRVYLIDQRVISFWPEKYEIDSNSDSAYIRGVGLAKNPQTRTEIKFEGVIATQEIDHIDIEEETSFTKIARPTAFVLTGVIILSVVIFSIYHLDLGG